MYSELPLRRPRLRWISRYYVQKQNPRLRSVGNAFKRHRLIRTVSFDKMDKYSLGQRNPKNFSIPFFK